MPTYLTDFSYTKTAWHEMVQHPEDREAAARSVIEANGGSLICCYWMFGDRDGLAIDEARDPVVAATVLAGIRASGRISELTTRSPLTGVEAQRVLEVARFASADYAPPGGQGTGTATTQRNLRATHLAGPHPSYANLTGANCHVPTCEGPICETPT